jgi:predicted RNase H-like nuclease (RuvC/YqgF family)
MRENGGPSSGNRKTRPGETPAVPSSDETQVKEEEFESVCSIPPVHFDNIGDDDSEDHPLQTSQTTSSLQPSTISRLPSDLDNKDAAGVQKLFDRNAELESRLKEEKTASEELVSENDKLHKAQLQLQQQNSKLRGKLRDLQKQHEEKCRQLRECKKQHPQNSQQERVKQEHVDDVAELQQLLQLQAGKRRENDAGAKVNADADVVSDEYVKLEVLGGDDEREVEAEEEEDDSDCSDGEDEDGSGSEEEDSDHRPSKR